MSEGKANAQAGHAYTDALIHSLFHENQDLQARGRAYAGLTPGTKICVDGGSLADLDKLRAELQARGIPHTTITDHGHIELPDFDGSPIVTAIGTGPIHRSEAPRRLKRRPLWAGGARARAV